LSPKSLDPRKQLLFFDRYFGVFVVHKLFFLFLTPPLDRKGRGVGYTRGGGKAIPPAPTRRRTNGNWQYLRATEIPRRLFGVEDPVRCPAKLALPADRLTSASSDPPLKNARDPGPVLGKRLRPVKLWASIVSLDESAVSKSETRNLPYRQFGLGTDVSRRTCEAAPLKAKNTGSRQENSLVACREAGTTLEAT
jgi:hypothetical protein